MTIYKGETSLETRKQAEEMLAELRRQAYAEGYEQGFKQASFDAEMGLLYEPTEDVIHLAKYNPKTHREIKKRYSGLSEERRKRKGNLTEKRRKPEMKGL